MINVFLLKMVPPNVILQISHTSIIIIMIHVATKNWTDDYSLLFVSDSLSVVNNKKVWGGLSSDENKGQYF